MQLRECLFVILAALASSSALQAQGLEQARAQFPVFSSDAEGQASDLYAYYPSVDFMVKVETKAPAGVFSDAEFGYLVGAFHSVVTEILANGWYAGHDEATLAVVAATLEAEAKTMKQPFQPPTTTLSMIFDTSGITFTLSGQSPEGAGEVSFTTKMTWEETLAQ